MAPDLNQFISVDNMESENMEAQFQSPVSSSTSSNIGVSGDLGPLVGSSTPNIIIKTEEDGGGECASRQGFIEVSTHTDGKQNVTLKSNASVSRRSHTPEVATSGKVSPSLDMLNFQSLKNTQNLQQMLRSGNQVFHISVQPPATDGKSTPPKPVQQMIIVKPDEDAEEIMSKTVNNITSKLNEQAAERLAQGYNPDRETVIEITRIATPSDGCFSRDNINSGKKSAENSLQKKEVGLDKQELPARSHHPRKSPLHKRQDVAPSLYFNKLTCVPSETKPSDQQPTDQSTNGLVFSNHSCFRSVNATSSCGDINNTQCTGYGQGNLPASMSTGQVQTNVPYQNTSTGKRSVTILSKARVGGQNTYMIQTSQPDSTCNSSSLYVVSEDSQPDSFGLSMDEDFANDSEDGSIMNDSLTNIHWLGHMKGDNLQVVNHKDMRLIASEKQIEKVNSECGKHKRPPYSYMHLIQMAICSKPDKKMTLKNIYSWIETKFPYYKSNPNKGWRNSIRHNLSLYDIFVREKINIPGKSMVSFWTLRSDIKPRTSSHETDVNLDDYLAVKTEPAEPASPVFFVQNDLPQKAAPGVQSSVNSSRKRPVPLLPKPSPDVQQTYALIPIQGGVPVVPSQPIMVPANWSNQYSMADVKDMSEVKPGVKRTASPEVAYSSKRKQIKIAPKVDYGSLTDQQPVLWQNYSNNSVYSLDSSDLQSQFSHSIRFLDSGFASLSENSTQDVSSSQDNTGYSLHRESSSEALAQSCKAALPDLSNVEIKQQKSSIRRGKRKRKSPHSSLLSSPSNGNVVNLSDSRLSDTGISDILASIEKDLSSPARRLLKTPTKTDNLFTSTPVKDGLDSPSWISPIRGFLTTDNGDVHSSLFTPPDKNKDKKTSTPLEKQTTPDEKPVSTTQTLEESTNVSQRESQDGALSGIKQPLQRSPKLGSLRGLGVVGLTPLKSPGGRRVLGGSLNSPSTNGLDDGEETLSFGKLLNDMHLDSIIEDGMQDMANLSFSQFGI